jgi:hypothetical protein
MNIEQAKSIQISVILDKMNLAPQRSNGNRVLYFSAFRKEKSASLWVDIKSNLWRDFGDTKWEGGDGIHLVRAYLDSANENCEVTDALRWLKNMTEFIPAIKPVLDKSEVPTEKTLVVKHIFPIKSEPLIEYGNSRCIPESVLRKYFEEVTVHNTISKKKFFALCMRNDLKGYELRNNYFKGCVGKKYISFIRGTESKPESINIFEGAFDFLSVIVQQEGKALKNDAIILHSLSNLKKASAYLKNYGYKNCYTWMDNDMPGKEATKSWEDFCKAEESLLHFPMNKYYEPYKDVNAAHVAKLEL